MRTNKRPPLVEQLERRTLLAAAPLPSPFDWTGTYHGRHRHPYGIGTLVFTMTLDVQAQDAAGFTGSVTIEPGQLFNSSISGRFVGGMLRSGRFRYQFREAGRRATLQWRRLEDGEVLQGRVTFRQRHQFRTNGTFLVRKDAPPATTP